MTTTTTTPRPDDSDYDSSSSSFTSRRSIISSTSFTSSRSSLYLPLHPAECTTPRKPHKSHHPHWEAIRGAGHVGLDHFRLLRRLGSGDLGNVYLCQLRDPRRSGCLYAMKVVDKDALAFRKKLQRAETEREILRLLDHPFLPTLYAEFEAAHYSCLVMEFCCGGDLHVARQRLPGRRFSVAAAKFYAAETVVALEYLHMMGIIYRDLKPENVLIRDDGHIMLSDFDLSLKCHVTPKLLKCHVTPHVTTPTPRCSLAPSAPSCALPLPPVLSCFYRAKQSTKNHQHDKNSVEDGLESDPEFVAEPSAVRSKSFVGTHDYLAPEVISGTGHGSAVDWWTLGVFLYEMIYGRTPFKGEDNEKTLASIMKQPLRFPRPSGEEEVRAQDLIARLLVKNPSRRIGSLKGAAEIKRHEFFKGVNWALIRQVRPPEVPKERRATTEGGKGGGGGMEGRLRMKRRDEFVVTQHIEYF